MPNLDGTGPLGQGPRTGRGIGRGGCCNRGGFKRFFSSKNDLVTLNEQEKILIEELDAVRKEKNSLTAEDK